MNRARPEHRPSHLATWLAAIAVTLLVGTLAATENGGAPTEVELAAAMAADLADARQQARQEFLQTARAALAVQPQQGQQQGAGR